MIIGIAIALAFVVLLVVQVRNVQTQGFVSPDKRR